MVDARARAEDESEGRDGVEERGVHADGAASHDDGGAGRVRRGRGAGEENREGLARCEEVEEAVAPAQRGAEGRIQLAAEEEEGREDGGLNLAGRRGGRHGWSAVTKTCRLRGHRDDTFRTVLDSFGVLEH